jgi:hypothetical protein
MLDPTATHLPVWAGLFKAHEIKRVLEFGCGLFSTRHFVDQGCEVTSIEMQHQEWFDRVKAEIPGVNLLLALGPDAWRELDLAPRYDAIFVDGHGDSRPECLEWAKGRTDLIVAHDTEHPYYDWDRAYMSGFKKTVHDALTPWTTVWVKE